MIPPHVIKKFEYLWIEDRHELLELLAGEDTNNWTLKELFPTFSLVEITLLRNCFGELYLNEYQVKKQSLKIVA